MKDKLEILSREVKVKIQGGEVTSNRSGEVYKFGLREFSADGSLKMASAVGELSAEKMEEPLAASALLRFNAKDQVPTSSQTGEWNYSSKNVASVAELSALAQTYLEQLETRIPNFVAQGHVKEIQEEITYSNALGAHLRKEIKNHELVLDLRKKGSPNICDASIMHVGLDGFSCEDQLELNLMCLEAFDKDVEVEAGTYRVLMPPDPSMTKKVGESLRADKYHEGSALYAGKIGERLFHSQVSFSDFRTLVSRAGVSPFDFEGQVNESEKTPLIENGKFVGLISDLKNERRYGVPSTGNGFRKYNSQVNLGFSALGLEYGKRSVIEILKEQDEVIVALMAFGGDLTEEGDFSTPIQLAFLVREGKVVGQVRNLSLSASLRNSFGEDFLEVSKTPFAGGPSDPYCLVRARIHQ